MNHCSEVVDIEDYVLGTIAPPRARELRAHLRDCLECQREETQVTRERALFARREELIAPPRTVARVDAAPAARLGLGRRIGARGVAMMSAAAACCALWAVVHDAPSTSNAPAAATRMDEPLASHAPAWVPSELSCELADPPPADTELACGKGLATREICEDTESHAESVTCSSVRQ